MLSNYQMVLGYVLAEEGGYTNHPADPGGPTNWGITIGDARLYWKPDADATDVKNMPKSVAEDIYKSKYWDKMRCSELPSGVDYTVMDYGVNSGIGRAGKVLRRALGLPDNTSVVDDYVIAKCLKSDPKVLINYINSERLAFLQSLKTWPTFGKGWGARVARVKARSLEMVGKVATQVTTTVAPTTIPTVGKGEVPVNKTARDATTGTIAGSGTIAAGSMSSQVEVALIVIGVTLVISACVYYYFHWKQKKDQEKAVPVILLNT